MSISEHGQKSRTALMVAAYRGRASARDGAVCHDPWAAALAGDEGRELAARFDAAFPHMELWIALRTAYIDAQVDHFTGRGTPQVVLLGAGLDTRAARLARDGVRFFEVDHPSTQADKRARLTRLDGYPADAATYVPCDFEKEDFLDRLCAEGFRPEIPALVIWEGVVPYLTEGAVRNTLRRLATGCDPRTAVVFDYFMKRIVESEDLPPKDRETRTLVAGLGEPVRFGTNHPLPMLVEEGFRHVRTISFDEIALDFTGTYDRARMFRFQHVALASRTVWSVV